MIEKMDDFFTARVNGYDEHMKSNIEGADSFYKYTASLLPTENRANILAVERDLNWKNILRLIPMPELRA